MRRALTRVCARVQELSAQNTAMEHILKQQAQLATRPQGSEGGGGGSPGRRGFGAVPLEDEVEKLREVGTARTGRARARATSPPAPNHHHQSNRQLRIENAIALQHLASLVAHSKKGELAEEQ